MKNQIDDWQRIKGLEHAKRAVEVALSGAHSIRFVGPPGNGKSMFRNIMSGLGHDDHSECWPCPCGYRGDAIHACECSAEDIFRHWLQFKSDVPEIIVEIPSIRFRDFMSDRPGEPLSEVLKRMDNVKKIKTFDSTIDSNCEKLLETVCNKLGYSARQLINIIDVGETIAKLDDKKSLSAWHISEAIAYSKIG